MLALAITYGGMLGKVYAEILESGDTRPARALLEAGSGRLGALFYGLLPSTAQELASYTVYRWECAVRASVVMGFVGAGGLGQLMDQSMKMLNGGEASTILLIFLPWSCRSPIALSAASAAGARMSRSTRPRSAERRAAASGCRAACACIALALLAVAAAVVRELRLSRRRLPRSSSAPNRCG